MTITPDHTNLHRTAKYFMDTGRAASHSEAVGLLEKFGLTIRVGQEIAHSQNHQIALLTLVNVARRTFLGGIAVTGIPDGCKNLSPLAPETSLAEAVVALGAKHDAPGGSAWPVAVIGGTDAEDSPKTAWRVTWEGWRGGVIPLARGKRLDEMHAISLAPVLAAAVCAAEVFAFHAGDHPMAGKREVGLSLWRPDADWLASANEPVLSWLPSRLWIIGLGNLGQAFAWVLATLPWQDRSKAEFILQDFDRLAVSNDSTSLLSFLPDVGRRKARVVASWLDRLGFETFVEERRFGAWTRRAGEEPAVALCGVDNEDARAALEDAGFDLVIEAGLGGGPQAFRSISLHSFPASRAARDLWSKRGDGNAGNFENMPAYQALKEDGMDECGLAQLASRTVGVPFVGLIASCMTIAELLRRLNGGCAVEFIAGSVSSFEFEHGCLDAPVYSHGHVPAARYQE
ncbi:MAG TPA: hypothetical protein VIM56_11330 [Rhizomicrobium sp.]